MIMIIKSIKYSTYYVLGFMRLYIHHVFKCLQQSILLLLLLLSRFSRVRLCATP